MADRGSSPFRILDLTAANPEARRDPYPRLAELRAQCPLHRDDAGGAWLVPRMADARAIFSDNARAKDPDKAEPAAIAIRRRRSTAPDGLAFPNDRRASMLELDGEEHAPSVARSCGRFMPASPASNPTASALPRRRWIGPKAAQSST